jgi:hypothetical protein
MRSNRFKKITKIYHKVAAPVDWKEQFKKLDLNKSDEDGEQKTLPKEPKSDIMKFIEQEKEKPVPKGPPPLPGELKEKVQYPVQLPLTPEESPTYPMGVPFKKVYSPAFSMTVQCPSCGARVDPIEQSEGKLTYRKECPRCQNIYNRIQSLVQDQAITPREAINVVFNEKHKKYSIDTLTKIWESGGNVDITQEEIIQNPKPGISTRVRDVLRFDLNVKRDKSGNKIYDKGGFPIPLKPPKFFTTYDLAKQLMWHPDYLVDHLEEQGHSALPIGGISRGTVPSLPPPERDISETERNLITLKKLYQRRFQPGKTIEGLKSELAGLKKELSQLETPGGPEMATGLHPTKLDKPIHSPKHRAGRVREIKLEMMKIQDEIQNLQKETGQFSPELKEQMESRIKELESTLEKEQKGEVGRERFKTSWYNVWNIDNIKDAIGDRLTEVEKIIRPLQKVQYFGSKIRHFEEIVNKAKAKQKHSIWSPETSYKVGDWVKASDGNIYRAIRNDGQKSNPVEEQKEGPKYWKLEGRDLIVSFKEQFDPKALKVFKILLQMRRVGKKELSALERKRRVTKDTLEANYGKELNNFLRTFDIVNDQRNAANKIVQRNTEKAQDYLNMFDGALSNMGYDASKETREETQEKIDKILGNRVQQIPKQSSLSYFSKQAADPKQLSLWEEEEEEVDLPSGGGVHFFGPGIQHKPVKIREKDPIESIAPQKKTPPKGEDEEEMVVKTPDIKYIEPTSREPVEFTKSCPYAGCGAKIPEDAKSCWKCKTPISTENIIHKVVKSTIRLTKEVEEEDPITGEKVKRLISFYPPKFSLITMELGAEGKPISIECLELPHRKRPGGSKPIPSNSAIWNEAQDEINKILEDPQYSDEQKKKVKTKSRDIYEWLFKNKQESGEIHPKSNPWQRNMPAIGIPRMVKKHIKREGLPDMDVMTQKHCDKCPDKIYAPFNKEKLNLMCPEMIKGLKSLTQPIANVWPYKDVRYVTESEIKAEEPQRGIESKPWYYADDKTASRFNKILTLSKKD